MNILGLAFAGSATRQRREMTGFLREILSLTSVQVDGVEADLFRLADGSHFAVSEPGAMGDTARSIGFLIEDLDAAIAELSLANVEVGRVTQNAQERYVHFRAPAGPLYELVERNGEQD
ncbi:MAG: VOC family protein [Jatrophihabitans sp.]